MISNNLINKGMNVARKMLPNADQMFNSAMDKIKGNATPPNFFNVLCFMVGPREVERMKKNKFFPLLENGCKQSADGVLPYAENTIKELGLGTLISSFIGKQN